MSFVLDVLVPVVIDYDERVLPSIVNEVTKAVVAKYNASELLTKREVGTQIPVRSPATFLHANIFMLWI